MTRESVMRSALATRELLLCFLLCEKCAKGAVVSMRTVEAHNQTLYKATSSRGLNLRNKILYFKTSLPLRQKSRADWNEISSNDICGREIANLEFISASGIRELYL